MFDIQNLTKTTGLPVFPEKPLNNTENGQSKLEVIVDSIKGLTHFLLKSKLGMMNFEIQNGCYNLAKSTTIREPLYGLTPAQQGAIAFSEEGNYRQQLIIQSSCVALVKGSLDLIFYTSLFYVNQNLQTSIGDAASHLLGAVNRFIAWDS